MQQGARSATTEPRPRQVARIALFAASITVVGACAATPRRSVRPLREVVTLYSDMDRFAVCQVRVQSQRTGQWTVLASVDRGAPVRLRSVRVPRGRWRFLFERCDRGEAIVTPPVSVDATRVVLLLCDDACGSIESYASGFVLRFRSRSGAWEQLERVRVPSHRRPARLIL